MCNRYRPASVVRIRDAFGFTYIESGPDMRVNDRGIGPLQPGPFVRRDEALVGQWGLIPDGSKTRKPTRANGRPMSTNNARFGRGQPEAFTFRGPWWRGQRCLVPVEDFDEPCYAVTRKNIWWRMRRADGEILALAGLWNAWTDPGTGEIVESYTMLTINCNAHPLLSLMHKPDIDEDGKELPADQQDKRTVVPIERQHWDEWLHGSNEQAAALVRLPAHDLFVHGPADPAVSATLPL